MPAKKMPAKLVDHFKAKPKPTKSKKPVPPALAKYHKAHPFAKSAPKSVKQQAIKKSK